MAEVEAGQSNAQVEPDPAAATPGAEGEGAAPAKTYTQADLDRITAKVRKNAARDAELRLRREQESRPQPAAGGTEKPADAKPAEEAPPKREDFATYEDYTDARTDFRARKATREENARIAEEARKKSDTEAAETRARTFKGRADKAMQEIPDFADVISDAHEVFISRAMADVMEESELGPRMLYELVKNPQEAERIAKLGATAQAREMFKLEAKIEAAAKKPAPKKAEGDDAEGSEQEPGDEDQGKQPGTDAAGKGEDAERNADGTFKPQKRRPAPDPIEPGSGRSSASSTLVPSDKDSIKEWMRKADLQARKEGRR